MALLVDGVASSDPGRKAGVPSSGVETDGGPVLVRLMEVMEHGLPLLAGCSLVLVASSA